MKLRLSFVFAAALASTQLGCSSDSSVPLSGLEPALYDAVCAQLADCPTPGAGNAFVAYIAANPAQFSCSDQLAADGGFGVGQMREAVDAGRIRYDAAAAGRCLANLNASCGAFSGGLEADDDCKGVFVGLVPLGGTCYQDEECAGDAHCDESAGCPGVCEASATLGQACDDVPCSRNAEGVRLECTSTTANPNPHCVAVAFDVVGAGESCGEVVADGESQLQAVCDTGLYCKRNLGAAVGNCAVPIPQLQTCVPNLDACAGDASCVAAPAGGFRCEPFTVATTAGAICDPTEQAFCHPLARLDCVGGTCTTVGTGAVGQPCRTSFGTDCNAGLYCDDSGASPVCATLIADGQPCDTDFEEACASGFCDDSGASPVCGSPLCL